MKRRDFLKSLFGAAALLALPTWLRRPEPKDFAVVFTAYKDPTSTYVSDIRSYLDVDSIEPINIPFRSDGMWHHYEAIRKKGEITWYVDGEVLQTDV